MDEAINRRELTYKALAGLAGGALGWLPVELASSGHSLTEPMSPAQVVAAYVTMALLAGMIGGMVLASDQQRLELTPDVTERFVRGFLVCCVLALPATYCGNYLFSRILDYGGWGLGHAGSFFFLVVGRVASWTVMGAMLGAGVGIASLSLANMAKGALGGWIGGFVGGLAFDFINGVTGGGLLSRLFGLSLVGLAIGLLIGLVHELTKMAWVTVDSGRLRGRQYRLERPVATIGRAEENPIGLFGDQSVQMRHAVIERRGNDYFLKSLAVQDGTFVNGSRIETARLNDGDRIRIGSYELGFHLRKAAGLLAGAGAAPRPIAPAPGSAQPLDAGPYLVNSAGSRFILRPGQATRVGRALDNDIVLAHASVSRHHASIEAQDGGFHVRDLNSQNGTYVGGERVTTAALKDGDAIRFGEEPFTFRA